MSLRIGSISLFAAILAVAGCSSSTPHYLPGPSPSPSPVTGPQSWQLVAGMESNNQGVQALQIYPTSITIDAGDTITWTVPTDEPHSVTFPILGQMPIAPTDPTASSPLGGTTYDGSASVSSGFLAGGATYSLTFPKPGTYTYYSLPQEPLVVGTVIVQAAGTAYPMTQAQITAAGSAAATADLQSALASVATVPYTPGSNMIAAGVAPASITGGANSTIMRFLNGPTLVDDLSVTIPVNTTLTFKNLSNNVPHTVTFPAVGATPPAGPPFQAATGGNTYDGTTLVNSGVIAPGSSFQLTFVKAGIYPYYCLFHAGGEGMVASVTVTP